MVELGRCPVRPYASVASARTIFIDASVWWAAGPRRDETRGDELVGRVATDVERAFAGAVHTVVVSFDKRRHVPAEKSRTQRARSERLGAEPLIIADDQPLIAERVSLPPWGPLRANRAAFERAQAELVELLVRRVRVPERARLIVDYASSSADSRPYVVTSRALERSDALANDVGEADMFAQRVQLAARGLTRSRWARAFRDAYECGDVVLWSVDTDYLTLAPLHDNRRCAHRVYVSTGRAEEPGYAELFDVRAFELGADALSFATVSALCGNDYVDKLESVSRRQLLDAYATLARPLAVRVDSHALVDPAALVELLARVYAARLGEAAPLRGDYQRLAASLLYARAERPSLPDALDEDQLVALYADVQWAVDYALRGPKGNKRVETRKISVE